MHLKAQINAGQGPSSSSLVPDSNRTSAATTSHNSSHCSIWPGFGAVTPASHFLSLLLYIRWSGPPHQFHPCYRYQHPHTALPPNPHSLSYSLSTGTNSSSSPRDSFSVNIVDDRYSLTQPRRWRHNGKPIP